MQIPGQYTTQTVLFIHRLDVRADSGDDPLLVTFETEEDLIVKLLPLLLPVLLAAPVQAAAPADLRGNLGSAPHAHLTMLFEVTFMSIDVATVDAYLTEADAARLEEWIQGDKLTKEAERGMQEVLLSADPVLVTMTFARDSGWGKFLNGIKGTLKTAAKCGFLSKEAAEQWGPLLEANFLSMEERGVMKNDAVYYLVEGNVVRTVYFDPQGEPLVDFSHENPDLAAGIRGGYFCEKSKFRKKLCKSLFEKD